jgi:polyisoprenyl-phosphate glycosyltransferase
MWWDGLRQMDSLTILIPAFNDWEALSLLLPQIDRSLAEVDRRASILIVDDAATDSMPRNFPGCDFTSLDSIDILHLRCNLGHQRAIALGLYHVHEFTSADVVLVMDGDGEDRPQDIPALLDEYERQGGRNVIFAARTRRMESLAFQSFYRAYQVVHRALTGVEVRVGNFSVMGRGTLARLMASPDLWNHYSASVYRARLPKTLLPLARGPRLCGHSKMNFVSLLMHGLSAICVHSEQVSARLVTAAAFFSVIALGSPLLGKIVPGWNGYLTGWIIGLALQLLAFAMLFAFLIASRRSSPGFIAQRDAPYYILGKTKLEALAQRQAH